MTDEQTEKLLTQSEQELANQLPPWAERLAVDGELEHGAQLPTRDGRRVGNGWIIGTNCGKYRDSFIVLTDAGSRMTLTRSEVEYFYYPPKYVGGIYDILTRFSKDEYE